jgi:hypothetical protein
MCPKGGKLENIALNLVVVVGGTKGIISTFELE